MSSQSPGDPEYSVPPSARPPLPAARALAWFVGGMQLLRAQPMRLLLLGLLLQFLGGMTQIGIMGVIFFIAMPALTAGMLEAVHRARLGRKPEVLTLFAAFRGSGVLGALLLLGVIGLVIAVVTMGVTVAGSLAGLDPVVLNRIESGDTTAVADMDPAVLQRALFAMVIGLFLGGTLAFYAIPLVWFRRLSLGRAIGAGIVAMFRQWRALLTIGALLALVGLPVGLAVGAMMAVQMVSDSPSVFITLALVFIMVAYQLFIFTIQYLSFVDIFGDVATPDSGSGPQGDDDADDGERDQLVA
ncbi:hypothetical protein F3N42_14140 [Marinihelvus fidelis]|uniref:Uncharacterized protein n=1 Tax=Marinihelvus fidelis TaxID=2613842 RepID=A0A5N0T916_9GAMM|nr:BPSS1780 family membrane protein [Marinihelvus fidelis]KAA9129789.1 hypothetical protein F3N42_14140 [Marinihelvus fidelis]